MTGDGFSHNHQVNLTGDGYSHNQVNFGPSRSFGKVLKSKFIETFFPDDPFRQFKGQPAKLRALHALKYFVPIFDWLSAYKLSFLAYDLIAGITIASMAIPQGISYANLAQLPPIIGLYSAFVPPLIYGVFGSSMNLAVGTVAACSLLIAEEISGVASPTADTYLYVSLVFTATLFSGILQLLLGLFRLGILVDFLSHSTITGFMGGTALLIILQQFKGLLSLKHFTRKTGVVNVIEAILHNRSEWRWQCFLIGMAFLVFLQITRYIRTKNPNLFYVSAMGPIVVVIVGCLMTYLSDVEKMGVSVVGTLHKGLPSLSTHRINFDSRYLSAPIKAGLMTGLIALAEGIAIGRSFAIQKNQQIDGNKEMVAFGLMNIVGSLTSCYLTTGPFSKTAVNVNAGCKTPMTNIVQSICMLLVLLFLAPIFSYTPQVALSAIIISAMLGLIKYEEYWHLFKTDKFDFIICMSAFFGVSFISMDMGLMISVGLSLIRALLYIARPATCKLGNIAESNLYRDIEQYPNATVTPGFLVLQLGSPIYFANSAYIKERILRWVRDEVDAKQSSDEVEYVLLDLGGVTAIDITGVEALTDARRMLATKGITMILVNPRIDVMEKLVITHFVDNIGRDHVFLSVEDAIAAHRFKLKSASKIHGEP